MALSGKLLSNGLKHETDIGKPHVVSTLHEAKEHRIEGTVDTSRKDDYRIAGVLRTSHGEVRTEVAQHASFVNRQTFTRPDASIYRQVIDQSTDVEETVTTKVDDGADVLDRHAVSYPLRLDVTKNVAPEGSFQGSIDMSQGLKSMTEDRNGNAGLYTTHSDESMQSHDEADFSALGDAIAHSHHQHATQSYLFKDSAGACNAKALESHDEGVASPIRSNDCQ